MNTLSERDDVGRASPIDSGGSSGSASSISSVNPRTAWRRRLIAPELAHRGKPAKNISGPSVRVPHFRLDGEWTYGMRQDTAEMNCWHLGDYRSIMGRPTLAGSREDRQPVQCGTGFWRGCP